MKWTLTNLLSVSSMTISGASLADGVFTFPAGVFCMINQNLPTPTVGHLYYGRVDQKVPAGTTFADGRFEYYAGDGVGLNIAFTSFFNATMDNEWHSNSDILSFPSLAASSGFILRSFSVSGSATVYRRNHLIVDLTAAFGAGKEPTKEWCDRCIPFFEGSTTIETSPLVGVGGIARKLKAGYVGVNGVARKIIAGYVGVNGVARKIWETQEDDLAYFIEGNFTTYENDLVTIVGENSMRDLPNLLSFSFPNATKIERLAFAYDSGLTDITLQNVTTIGENAFVGCFGLSYVTILSNQVCSITNTSFPDNVLQFRVPSSLVSAYKADETWASFADKIVGI